TIRTCCGKDIWHIITVTNVTGMVQYIYNQNRSLVSNDLYKSYRIDAPAAYSDVVTHFYIARNDSNADLTRNLIPSFQAILVFNFGARATMTWEGQSEIYSGNCLLFGPVKK